MRHTLDGHVESLRDDLKQVTSKYKSALRELRTLRDEHEAMLDIKHSTAAFKIQQLRGGDTSEAVAVALASDWHVEEEVRAATVNNLNRYNLDIAKRRSVNFFQRIEKMVRKEQQDVAIKTLVLGLLGDFITGRIHEENLETCLLRPTEAIIFCQELLESGIRFLLEHTKLQLVIVCHSGNHARITKRIHSATEVGNSLEHLMYHTLKVRFAGEKRITFIVPDSYHSYVDLYGYVARFHHGHNIRYAGGVGGLTIPVNKAIHQWNVTKRADWDFFGHFHSYHPMQRWVCNGSMIGHNAFAISIKAEFQRPLQAFFLLDRRRGKTVHIPLLFD